MEDKEEEVTTTPTGRKTRSGRAVKISPAAASKPKPLSRKTRKKVVLMEVEVSEDEEETSTNNKVVDSESDQPAVESAPKKKEISDAKLDQNGSEDASDVIKQISDDSVLVLNDVEMLSVEDSNDEEKKNRPEKTVQEKCIPDFTQLEKTKMKVESPKKKSVKKSVVEVETIQSGKAESSEKAIPEKKQQQIERQISPEGDLPKVKEDANVKKPKNEPTSQDQKQPEEKEEAKASKKRKVDAETDPQKKAKIEEEVKKPDSQIKSEEIKGVEKPKTAEEKRQEIKPKVEVTQEAKSTTEVKKEIKTKPELKKDGDVAVKLKVGEKETAKEPESKKKDSVEDEKVTEEKRDEKDKAKKDTSPKKKDSTDAKKEDAKEKDKKISKQNGDPDAENISEDELPAVQVAKVPEAEEVSDEELPGPKRAELPADTEVVSDDELPASKTEKAESKKSSKKRKLDESNYDPCSPTSESETPTKKAATDSAEKEKEEKKPKKLPELDKYWKAVNDDPTDFTGWTYLLQYVDQENDMEAAREAYDAFLSHYPYCYGYWRKYADYEKRKGNKKKCEEVFERGLKAIPLSVDLWLHYLTYVKQTRSDDDEYIRSQFERALAACGLEFRSDRLWDQYVKWETEGKRPQKVTAIYDRLLATPTQGYTAHFDNFQEHVASNPPNKIIEVDEFLALRKEVRLLLKHDPSTAAPGVTTGDDSSGTAAAAPGADDEDAPPGDDKAHTSSDEESKAIKDRIVSIRRKIHKATVNAVTARWNYEEGIKRPYFHVKPLERCQLKNWQDYLDYEMEQGDKTRIIVLFERCLIACALYEEFWLKFVHYLEGLKDSSLQPKIRDVYERACTIHHLKKPNLHLQWAMFEEGIGNLARAAEILVNLEKSVPNVLQVAYRRINLERRRGDFEKCTQLYEHYINNSKNKMISSNIAIKFSRFCFKVVKDFEKAQDVLKTAITKDPNNPRLYLQLIDLTLQKSDMKESDVTAVIDTFLDKDTTDADQKVLFAQRKLEYLEDFGGDIFSVHAAYEQYQKLMKLSKDTAKKKESKSSDASSTSKKEKNSTTPSTNPPSSYTNYSGYAAGSTTSQPAYPYTGQSQGQYNYPQYGQSGDQYQYQNWQYPQGGYSGYNQWGGYGSGYGGGY